MSLPPVEIPLGAMRFNSDSQKLEYWNGQIWMQIHTFSPNLDGGARGFVMGGTYSSPGPGTHNEIRFITIPTAGNTTDFGNLTHTTRDGGSCASRTRGLYRFGTGPGDINDNVDFITMSSTGDAADFGESMRVGTSSSSACSATRMVYGGASGPGQIDYLTIATTGNSIAFGDMTVDRSSFAAASDCIRGVFMGGDGSPAQFDEIDYITIATQGNAVDFGDLPYDNQQCTGCSNGHGGLG